MIKNLARKLFFRLNGGKVLINSKPTNIPEGLIQFFSVKTDNIIEMELINFIKKNLNEGDVFIDVGSNIGLISLAASDAVGSLGKVIAFDPNSWVYSQFHQIIHKNNICNIKLFELAVSDRTDWLKLNMNNADSILMTRSSLLIADSGSKIENVLSVTLDQFVPTSKSVRMVKVDVEGAELAVLKGARKLITACKPIVCLEVHGLFFDNPSKHVENIFSFFNQYNYKCYNLYKSSEEDFPSFINDTGFKGVDELSGQDLAKCGYGQLVFYPDDKELK